MKIKRSLKTFLLGLLFLLVALAWPAKHWLLDSSPVPEVSDYKLDLAAVRTLARSVPGPMPVRLDGMIVGRFAFPDAAVVAGSGWKMHEMIFTAFRADYPAGGRSGIIIDTAFDEASQRKIANGRPYFPKRWQALQDAMTQASAIVMTHEHPDHLGGVGQAPDLGKISSRVVLTREQADNGPSLRESGLTPEKLGSIRPLEYKGSYALAPGVVLIQAPGHTPGSQIIYVSLQNGHEFLFVGDIAWSTENIDRLRGRPWLLSRMFLHENREQVAAQLRTLHDLVRGPAASPRLHLIVAHDSAQFEEYVKAGLIHEGF